METLCRIPRFFDFYRLQSILDTCLKVTVWTLGSFFFLDYTNISRKGGGEQKHNLSLCTDLVFRKQAERLTD